MYQRLIIFYPISDISAYPDSVNVLEGVENDSRTPNKLIDGLNDTQDGTHMWLAPILPGIVSRGYWGHFQSLFREVQYVVIGADNGLAPTRQQVIT